jgi:uncharacterized protein (TIGR02117 family)
MQRVVVKVVTFILWLLGTVAGMAVLFLLAAFVLSSIPVNSSFAQATEGDAPVEIYVTSNGVHTDIVVPVATSYIDWREKLPLQHFAAVDSTYTHLSFGWGDRRFYMETPEWSDLTLGVALRASFWPTPTAMHVEYIPTALAPTKQQRPVVLSVAQYKQLVHYINSTFQEKDGHYIHIIGSGYTTEDTFYEAHGKFYILKNCNNWVNQGLKAAGIKTALWAPLPFAVMRHLR